MNSRALLISEGRGNMASQRTNEELAPTPCCGVSPRAFGQRVSARDRWALARSQVVKPYGGAADQLVPFAAAQLCRGRSFMDANRMGLTLPMPSHNLLRNQVHVFAGSPQW